MSCCLRPELSSWRDGRRAPLQSHFGRRARRNCHPTRHDGSCEQSPRPTTELSFEGQRSLDFQRGSRKVEAVDRGDWRAIGSRTLASELVGRGRLCRPPLGTTRYSRRRVFARIFRAWMGIWGFWRAGIDLWLGRWAWSISGVAPPSAVAWPIPHQLTLSEVPGAPKHSCSSSCWPAPELPSPALKKENCKVFLAPSTSSLRK